MGYGPYTIQENGQVTLPKELRREYGLAKGDTVVFERTGEGWVVRKDEPDPMKLLDELGEILAARGVTLDELIASGRDIRGEIVREVYGQEPTIEGVDLGIGSDEILGFIAEGRRYSREEPNPD